MFEVPRFVRAAEVARFGVSGVVLKAWTILCSGVVLLRRPFHRLAVWYHRLAELRRARLRMTIEHKRLALQIAELV